MLLQQAKQIADNICSQLYPWCEIIFIAGSIRREKPEVRDIEIVCIPKRKETGGLTQTLFDDLPTLKSKTITNVQKFVDTVNQWPKIKGEPKNGKYTRRVIPGKGIELDLFMCNQNNLGLILSIRTGSENYCKKLMMQIDAAGYKCDGGYLWQHGQKVPVPDEETLYSLIGIPFFHPKNRNV